MGDFWVFGYGSLMWRPGFNAEEVRRARLYGHRRALCVRSRDHRGTPEAPGLVLGLERGGACVGLAFRVSEAQRAPVLAQLRARELVSSVYAERTLPVVLDDGRTVDALAYVVNRGHPDHAAGLSAPDAAAIVGAAVGESGSNSDYLFNTLAHLATLGLRDRQLEAVAGALTRQAA